MTKSDQRAWDRLERWAMVEVGRSYKIIRTLTDSRIVFAFSMNFEMIDGTGNTLAAAVNAALGPEQKKKGRKKT